MTDRISGSPDISQAYRTWSARARALVSRRSTAESGEDVRRLQSRLRRLVSLVPHLAPRTRQRLLEVVGGEDAEPDRDAGRQGDVAQAPRRLARDVLEVRGLAADHAAERDD